MSLVPISKEGAEIMNPVVVVVAVVAVAAVGIGAVIKKRKK